MIRTGGSGALALPPRSGAEGLSFFLAFASGRGGVWEQTGDTAMVLLPEALQSRLDLPEEFTVTADPEAAREDGAVLIIPGHPVLDSAAAAVLVEGDAGCCHLPWPRSVPPSAGDLVELARGAIQVDHGRIDATGQPPVESYLPAIRMGVLVSYATSLEDRFQEREEVWVDGVTGLPLPDPVLSYIKAGTALQGRDRSRPSIEHDLPTAVAHAHALVEERAIARRLHLARHNRRSRDEELKRANAYYDSALAAISSRTTTAAPERRQLLAAQAEVTRAERQRRLAEIEERFEPRHELQPFRLHRVEVPALSLAVQVRRGARTYTLTLRFIPAARWFAPIRCPHCGASDALVAGRERLGCRACLSPSSAETRPDPRSSQHPSPEGLGAPVPGAAPPSPPAPAPPRPPSPTSTTSGSGGSPAPQTHGPSAQRPASRAAGARRASSPPEPVGRRIRGVPAGLQLGRAGAQPRQIPEERLERWGEKLSDAFWDRVANGDRWRSKQVIPGSPMAALAQLYGSEGPLRAIGVPRSARPEGVTTLDSWADPGYPNSTMGWLTTDLGRFPWVLRWYLRDGRAVVGEVLPHDGGSRLPLILSLSPHVAPQLLDPPAPRIKLDPVGALIWEEGVGVHGLNLVLRCLACWWGIEPASQMSTYGAPAMAQAVTEQVRRRSGLPRVVDQPSLFGPDPDDVAQAARQVARILGPAARPW